METRVNNIQKTSNGDAAPGWLLKLVHHQNEPRQREKI